MEERNYYMIRAMLSKKEHFDVFFTNNVAAVGWSDINFSEFNSSQTDELIDSVKNRYYSNAKITPQIGKKLNEIRRFKRIKNNDVIIVPFNNYIRIGIVQGDIFYDCNSKEEDLANQINVFYKINNGDYLTIPRCELSEALQRRLRVRGSTVSDLGEFTSEINKIMKSDNFSHNVLCMEENERLINKFKEDLLHNICEGKTHLKAGGVGLEKIVKELFECEGYTARICSKRGTEGIGDVDIEAKKSDKFIETRVVAQVKHHNGISSDWGIEQLKAVKDSGEYDNSTYVFITSGIPSETAKALADKKNIQILDGYDLVDWIYENISRLSNETLFSLGIYNVPQMLL